MEIGKYLAIDLKSFYASVECVERGLDPLTTNLVVADASRTEKTICLAVSPSLKSYGVGSRPRLFEVIARLKEVNALRRWGAAGKRFVGESYNHLLLKSDPNVAVGYITAPPRMALYMEYSARIYGIYLKFFAPEDIHVYSIDEVFIDITHYLKTYKLDPAALAKRVILQVLKETGITATVGIGTNLYLAKVAMDIVAKHMKPDKNGVRIASLDEMSYRRMLWSHKPLTDFWRVGRGYERKLNGCGVYTMGDLALLSLQNEDVLYKLFGVNAELLIDHAWGYEPCTIADIKSYKPASSSLTTGQVLSCAYTFDKARLVAEEMCDLLVLDLVDKGLAINQITLTVAYDADSLKDPKIASSVEIGVDYYGRPVPVHSHGSANLSGFTSSTEEIVRALVELFDRIVNKRLLIRKINICACNVMNEKSISDIGRAEQLDFFTDYTKKSAEKKAEGEAYEREKRRQRAEISIKKRFGKNAILKGINFEDGATAIERNMQIGGHKA